jgi:hypothetical protein
LHQLCAAIFASCENFKIIPAHYIKAERENADHLSGNDYGIKYVNHGKGSNIFLTEIFGCKITKLFSCELRRVLKNCAAFDWNAPECG